ncbi:hypothetical protein [Mariniblastus fucicola]|uniref:Uncharacterized protein n=1 Tax=Mariniblastus fucicola TaxID=980251 RepID=A0A5B9PBI7_9BACT|nr:hypothetical protein [Mariniblastus fucicola]QEG20501.1 hypothetical protein MFFC18_03500 [Mariniblastus fucicola]
MRPENSADLAGTEQIYTAELDDESSATNDAKRISFIEQILSPQSLQWMMACGSGLLMLGLVIWLWSVGVFENPIVVAVAAGAATLSLLAGGMSLTLKTRHQLAGRWLTLLGAVALPLNLWLYDAQGLITLAEGGHLWIPAAMCCVLYAGIARALRDATFVYAMVGGVVLTGMLFLADLSIGRFWEWLPPAKFLLAIGWGSVFAERLFAEGKSKFSRSNFGAAFFRSGMIVVVSGLALVASGFASFIVSSFLGQVDSFWALTSISTNEKIWALGMVSASALGMFVQGFLRKSNRCHAAALSLGAFSVAITVNLLAIPVTGTLLASVVAGLVIVANVGQAIARRRSTNGRPFESKTLPLLWSQAAVVCLLIVAGFQIVVHLSGVSIAFVKPIAWWNVLQYALTAAASWSLAWNTRKGSKRRENSGITVATFSAIGALAAMTALWAGVWIQNVIPTPSLAVAVSVIPVLIGFAFWFAPGDDKRSSLFGNVACTMTLTHLFLFAASTVFGLLMATHAGWAIVLGAAAVAFLVASRRDSAALNQVLSLLASVACLTVWGVHLGFNLGHCLILAPMIVATSIKLLHHFIGDHVEVAGMIKQKPIAMATNLIIAQAGLAAVLLGMSRWVGEEITGTLMVVMLCTLGCTVLASFLTRNNFWRTVFRTLILAIVGSSLCVFDGLLDMNAWHRGEICCLVGGAILVGLGHLAWLREDDADADMIASISLFTGSLLIALPLASGLVFYRVAESPETQWRLFHEIATIAGSLILLGSGLLCRIRSTTVCGGVLMLTFIGSLVTLVRIPDQLQNASVAMMVGGGVFLASAILMSIYRDRLIALPNKMRAGDGVFQVLKWR